MDKKELEAFAREADLNAELDHYLGYRKNEKSLSGENKEAL